MPLDMNLALSQYIPTVRRRRGRRGLGLNPTCWLVKTLNLFQLKCSVADPTLYLHERSPNRDFTVLHVICAALICNLPLQHLSPVWSCLSHLLHLNAHPPTCTPAPTSLSILFIKPVCPAEPRARLPARISCQTRLQNGKLYFTLTDAEFTTCFTKRSQIRGLSPTQEKTIGPLLIWHVILITAQVCMIELMLAPDRM